MIQNEYGINQVIKHTHTPTHKAAAVHTAAPSEPSGLRYKNCKLLLLLLLLFKANKQNKTNCEILQHLCLLIVYIYCSCEYCCSNILFDTTISRNYQKNSFVDKIGLGRYCYCCHCSCCYA